MILEFPNVGRRAIVVIFKVVIGTYKVKVKKQVMQINDGDGGCGIIRVVVIT